MALTITKTDVWVAEIEDRSGGLATKLEALAAAGANLEFILARRQPDKPGTGVVFVTPIKGRKLQDAATKAGFRPADPIATLKVEGNDRPGLGSEIARAVGSAGINMRGTSAAVLARKFICYLGFDNAADAAAAAKAIRRIA